MVDLYSSLNPQKALIWRIVHRDNLPWVLENGLHCGNSAVKSANWISIGNPELIDKRASHPVPVPPGGCLNDYVPFYFTPFSPMLRNIYTGWGGIQKRPNDEIVILVSSIPRVRELGLPYLFTDSHAINKLANFYSDPADLQKIDWQILRERDFKRDENDLAKFGRYQAEALIHGSLPVVGLIGAVCYTNDLKAQIDLQVKALGLDLNVVVRPGWYFQ